MIAILDVSAAIEILPEKEKCHLFKESFENASWIIAPDLFVSEMSNVLWKYFKARIITHAECIQYAEDGISMVDDFVDARDLWKERTLGEGIKNNHPVYDMYYSVLARRNDATLITNDGQLATLCKKLKIVVCNY